MEVEVEVAGGVDEWIDVRSWPYAVGWEMHTARGKRGVVPVVTL